MAQKILCIGSCGKDTFLPMQAEILATPEDVTAQKKILLEAGSKIYVDDRFEAPGGGATNVSAGIAKLGGAAAVAAVVGVDPEGLWLRNRLQEIGVDCTHLEKREEVSTDSSAILVDRASGERVIVVSRDAGERLAIKEQQFVGYDWCYVSSLAGDAASDNARVIQSVVASGQCALVYNPGQNNIAHKPRLVMDLLAVTKVLFVNKDEAIEIVLHAEEHAPARAQLENEAFLMGTLCSYGAQIVILTDGKRGAWVDQGTQIYYMPTKKEQIIVDTTGAGDAFVSGFVAALLQGQETAEAFLWGAANADNVLRAYGAHETLLTTATRSKATEGFALERIERV